MTAERLDHFMARANAIYYATRDPFADFTTSPEISQVFGEIIGLWAAVTWQLLGSPDPVILVEAGPGRGTLMADALRAVRGVMPAFAAASRLHLIETSPRLRAAQAARLQQACWHHELATVPRQPMILLANEFLDALPIRQFVRRGAGWTERFVDAGRWIEQPAEPAAVPTGRGAAEGDIIELNEPARHFVAAVATRARQHQAPRCCSTTGRSAAPPATVCRPSPTGDRSIRCRPPGPPTLPRTWISPIWRKSPGSPAARSRAPHHRAHF